MTAIYSIKSSTLLSLEYFQMLNSRSGRGKNDEIIHQWFGKIILNPPKNLGVSGFCFRWLSIQTEGSYLQRSNFSIGSMVGLKFRNGLSTWKCINIHRYIFIIKILQSCLVLWINLKCLKFYYFLRGRFRYKTSLSTNSKPKYTTENFCLHKQMIGR